MTGVRIADLKRSPYAGFPEAVNPKTDIRGTANSKSLFFIIAGTACLPAEYSTGGRSFEIPVSNQIILIRPVCPDFIEDTNEVTLPSPVPEKPARHPENIKHD